MSSIVSKWPVLVSLPLTSADADAAGRLAVAAGERLFATARDEYLAACRTLVGSAVEVRDVAIAVGTSLVEAGEVTVSVNVAEILPDRFTMTMRARPGGDDGILADGTCSVVVGGGITREIRDELIEHAHGARHYH